MAEKDYSGIGTAGLLLLGAALFALYVYVVKPMMQIIGENLLIFTIMFGAMFIAIILGAAFFFYSKLKGRGYQFESGGVLGGQAHHEAARSVPMAERHEKTHRQGGKPHFLSEHLPQVFGRGKEVHGRLMSQEENKTNRQLVALLADGIKKFKASSASLPDAAYRKELHGHLRNSFPEMLFKLHADPSLPSITVSGIAIHVKGRADDGSILALVEKCRAHSLVYPSLILVLFEPSVSDGMFAETVATITKFFENFRVMLKN